MSKSFDPALFQELGFSTTDGAGISVEDLRKVARLMILEASDQLPQAPEPPVAADESEADKADFVKEKKKKSRMSSMYTTTTYHVIVPFCS